MPGCVAPAERLAAWATDPPERRAKRETVPRKRRAKREAVPRKRRAKLLSVPRKRTSDLACRSLETVLHSPLSPTRATESAARRPERVAGSGARKGVGRFERIAAREGGEGPERDHPGGPSGRLGAGRIGFAEGFGPRRNSRSPRKGRSGSEGTGSPELAPCEQGTPREGLTAFSGFPASGGRIRAV